MKKTIILGFMLTAFFADSSNATNSAQRAVLTTKAVSTDIPPNWVLVSKWTVDGITYKKYWTTVEYIIVDETSL